MGQFSVEKPVLPGSVLSGNQQTALLKTTTLTCSSASRAVTISRNSRTDPCPHKIERRVVESNPRTGGRRPGEPDLRQLRCRVHVNLLAQVGNDKVADIVVFIGRKQPRLEATQRLRQKPRGSAR